MTFGFIERIVELERQVAELDRRGRNRKRTGVVDQVDTAKGVARVKIADGEQGPYLTGWLPWKEIAAGGIKSHIPPTKGEQVDVVSENGDLTDAVIDMSTPSNANPRPHDGPEAVITKGGTRITISDGAVEIVADVSIKGALTIVGPSVTHNGKSIGDTHEHTDVTPGAALTGPPA
jgi:phage baseplate assembly protein gpV